MTKPILAIDTDHRFPHFIVLKASAGSGKTHTLTERFVQFILSDTIPNNRLRNILAVTFSNNAAREMKERILLWLKSACFEDPEKMDELTAVLNLDRARLPEKAEGMISEILESYADFQVRTIDSFMATVFKASALDFGYNPDFDILMNNDAVMEYSFNLFLKDVREGSCGAKLFDEVISMLNENKRKDTSFLWDPSYVLLDETKKIYRKLADGQKPKARKLCSRDGRNKGETKGGAIRAPYGRRWTMLNLLLKIMGYCSSPYIMIKVCCLCFGGW